MRRNRQRAFTLVEMVVVIAILAILVTIAYPSYQDQVRKSRRTDAKQSLTLTAQQLERCYSRYRRFNSLDCPQVGTGPTVSTASGDGHYQISSKSPAGVETLAAESFTLFATPQGVQAADTRCALFSLTNASAQAAKNTGGSDTTDQCW